MLKIPLDATPNQQFNIVLDDQPCTLRLYQRGDFMYLDLSVSGEAVRTGAICQVLQLVLQYKTPAFSGDFIFDDVKGSSGRVNYEELETRYQLYYLTGDELDELQQ